MSFTIIQSSIIWESVEEQINDDTRFTANNRHFDYSGDSSLHFVSFRMTWSAWGMLSFRVKQP
ncbi:MAG: hypothetical protein JXR58_03295 [Bacteroidales bacterium]|nr:hypothetical protein [Bacteroidales bacterium]